MKNHAVPNHLESYAQIALSLAEKGGEVLKKFWGNLQDIRDKEIVGDLVTEADKESEKQILALVKQKCPSHAVLAEESGEHLNQDKEFLWVIDPLDGTINYAHQFPVFAVSVALLFQGKPIVGVIYNPIQKELFQTTLGQGVKLNGSLVRVSTTQKLSHSLMVSGFPYDRLQTTDNNYAEFCHMTNLTLGVRRCGSAALDLAYIAAGRFDGYWERGIKPWDIAAGMLMVEEAGGKVSNYEGTAIDIYTDKILASNGLLHNTFSKELLTQKKV